MKLKIKNFPYCNRNYFLGHDDRTNRSHDSQKFPSYNKPRVSFKKSNHKPDRAEKIRRNILIKHQFGEDVSMSTTSNNNSRQTIQRGNPRGKGFFRERNSPLPHGIIRDNQQRHHSIPNSESNWYRVSVSS